MCSVTQIYHHYLLVTTPFSVLNELVSDIDDLLDVACYSQHIEKIKTIGSTIMGASGLRETSDEDTAHLETLIDFCVDIQNVVESFNKDLLWFRYKNVFLKTFLP